MKPTYQQTHIDVALTNISVAYIPDGFIADQIFPNVPVQKISGKYYIYTKADFLRRDAAVRAPGTRASRGGYGQSTGLYTCVEYAIAQPVPDEIQANADAPLNPLRDATQYVTSQIYLQKESDVAGTVFGNSVWSGSSTPSPTWDNDASVPVTNVETAKYNIVSTIGRLPNVGVMGYNVLRYLMDNGDILERIKYSAGPTAPAKVTVQALAALFGLDKLLVGTAIEDTAAEGATSSLSFLWGPHMALAYVAPTPSLMSPSAGYIFSYQTREVSRFREDQERTDIVEGRESWDTAVVASDAGYLLKSVVPST